MNLLKREVHPFFKKKKIILNSFQNIISTKDPKLLGFKIIFYKVQILTLKCNFTFYMLVLL